MRWLLCLACLILTAPTSAETIFRCQAKGGRVSLQSSPCPAGTEQTTRTYEHRDNPEAIRRRAEIEARMHAERVARPSAGARRSYRTFYNGVEIKDSRDVQRARCQEAKADRERTLRAVGLKRNFDLLRRLDDAVYRACKGV